MTGRVAPGVDPASHSRSVLPTTRGVTTGQVGPRASESSSLRQGEHERHPLPTRPTPSHKIDDRSAPSAVSAPSAAMAGPTPASGPREPASDAQYREATAELTVKPTHAAAKHQVGCPGSGGRSACTEESESGAESGERAAGERRSAGASSGSVAQCSGRVTRWTGWRETGTTARRLPQRRPRPRCRPPPRQIPRPQLVRGSWQARRSAGRPGAAKRRRRQGWR